MSINRPIINMCGFIVSRIFKPTDSKGIHPALVRDFIPCTIDFYR